MSAHDKFVAQTRRRLGDVENALVDELVSGRIDRRTFLQHGSRLGIGLTMLHGLAGALGFGLAPRRAAAQGTRGGVVRAGVAMPHGAIDPVLVTDSASYQLLFQVAEYLCVTQPDLTLKPVLAESWTHSSDGSVWTFKLRRGVRFHNGREMNAADVVATFDRLSDPSSASTALSVFTGLLSKGGTRRIDDYTVAFHLDTPSGNFPYAVGIDNYNAVIIPADYAGHYEADFQGTGPFRMESYRPREGASLVRNPDYWGPKSLPDRVEFKFYADIQPRLIALETGEVDVLDAIPVVMTPAIQGNPDIRIISVHSANHRQVHMRCDRAPFTDVRVRKALALSLDRKKLLDGLCRGLGFVGNDSPFSPAYPSTDSSVAQRDLDLATARQLMQAAGYSAGFDVTLTTERYADIPEYAQLIQNFGKAPGIRIGLKVETQALYYGKSVPGQSDWLDSTLGITDYAHRGVPNAYLENPLLSNGRWNAAHFKSAAYDALVPRYVRALDVQSQRSAARDIQKLLLDETPLLISYFPDLLIPIRKELGGLPPIAAGLLLDRVYRS
jgi:peptide/nickel transport system substrate-binding protein